MCQIAIKVHVHIIQVRGEGIQEKKKKKSAIEENTAFYPKGSMKIKFLAYNKFILYSWIIYSNDTAPYGRRC